MSFSNRSDDRRAFGAASLAAGLSYWHTRMCAAWRLTLFSIVLFIFPVFSRAANITLHGSFTADDNVQLFSVLVAAPATVDFRSYGYAGGSTSTGVAVPRGGFDTILTLFNASGVFIDDNDEGAGVATDPITRLAADARLTETLTPGNYTVALTEFDNFSIGNLADGFAEAGHPNFTADPSFTTGGPCPGNLFRDISGTAGRCRTGNWTLDFVNVASVTPIASPEPSALLLAGLGLGLLAVRRLRNRRKAVWVAGTVLAVILTRMPLRAQTNSGPDYSNVTDFLNGQRTLLQVQDLQVVVNTGHINSINIVPITTSNSNQTLQPTQNPSGSVYSDKPLRSFSADMFNQASAVTLNTLNDFNNLGTLYLQIQNAQPVINPNNSNGLWVPTSPGDDPLF